MAFRFPSVLFFALALMCGVSRIHAQEASASGSEESAASEQSPRLADKLRDDVVAEERLKAIDALLEEAEDEPATILVDLLTQRAPRKPFEQLVGLIGGEGADTYRRDEFIVPLALALAAGDSDSTSIRSALIGYRSGDLLSHARELLASDETQAALAGIALVHLRPKGTVGVVSVVEALVEMLEHDEEEVSRRAYDALRAVTYLELANDPEVWEDWLDRYDSESERMRALADAAVRHLEELSEQNNKLQEALLVEITQQMEREKANDPRALALRLESPYLRIREMAASMLAQLLPGMQDVQLVATLIASLQERLNPALHESAEVQLQIAKALATRPQEAFDAVDTALRRNHLPPAVKVELLKALKTPHALPLLAYLLSGADGKVVDPVHLQVIDQVKVCADANAMESLDLVYARFASLLGRTQGEEGAQRQVVDAILDTLRYLVSLKSVSIEGLLPSLKALIESASEDRSTVFDLLTKAVQSDRATAKLLTGDQAWSQTLEAVALSYPVAFDSTLVAEMRSLLELYRVIAVVPDAVREHFFALYRGVAKTSGEQVLLRKLLLQALARFLVLSSQTPTQSFLEVLAAPMGFETGLVVLDALKPEQALDLVLDVAESLESSDAFLKLGLLEGVVASLPDDATKRGRALEKRDEVRRECASYIDTRFEAFDDLEERNRLQVLDEFRVLVRVETADFLLPLFFLELEEPSRSVSDRREIASLVFACLQAIDTERYADLELVGNDQMTFDQAVARLRERLEADESIDLAPKKS